MTPEWEAAYKACDTHYEVCIPCSQRTPKIVEGSNLVDWEGQCEEGKALTKELRRARELDPSYHIAVWEMETTGKLPEGDHAD